MANKLIKALCLLFVFLPQLVFAAGPVWPGLYGHGTDWSLSDAPGTGDFVVCVIDDLTASGSAIGSLNSSYGTYNQSVYEGNLQYCNDLVSEDGSGNPNGKVVLLSINGNIYDSGGDILYLETNDWTIMDFNPPGLNGDGALLKNIMFYSFDGDSGDEDLVKLFIKDLRMLHGSGRNNSEGSPGNATSTGENSRKNLSIYASSDTYTVSDIVIYKGMFGWSLDGPLELWANDGAEISNITVAYSIIGVPIAYDAMEEWVSTTTYDKWARVSFSGDSNYYESINGSNLSHTPTAGTDNTYWRMIPYSMTDQTNDNWKGLTTYGIEGYSNIRNLYYSNGMRNPLFGEIRQGHSDNNIIYNGFNSSTTIFSDYRVPDNDIKATFIGNLGIGGPNSGAYTDEYFPRLSVYEDGWNPTTILDSNTSNSSSTNTTLCDTSKDWADDEWNGYSIRIVGGTGSGSWKAYGIITDTNGTSECVTIGAAWTTNPDTSSDYEIVSLADHDLYIADNTTIECDSAPCASNYTVRSQTADLPNPYDWGYVDNRMRINESEVKHTTIPTGAHVSGYTYLDVGDVETILLANDGTGVGAYNANQDTIAAAIFSDVNNRTNTALSSYGTYKPKYLQDSHYPTITGTSARTLDLPEDMHSDCGNGYTRLEEWMHSGNIDACSGGGEGAPPHVVKFDGKIIDIGALLDF